MTRGISWRLRIPSLALGMLMMTMAFVALAQTATPPKKDEEGMGSFGKMIPAGYVNRDVTIPSFSKGAKASLLTAATLTRLDDDRLVAEQVVVELYGKEPADTLRVELKTAVYNMTEKVMRSGDRSRVIRQDFEMEGDSMVFDTNTSIGAMKGRVRTLIFDTGAVSGKSEATPQPSN